MPGDLPRGRWDRVGSGQGSEGGLRAQPPGMGPADQDLGGADRPDPGSSSSHGAMAATSRSSSARSPAASASSSWIRWAVEHSARTVMRCTSERAGRARSLAQPVICRLVASPRSSARGSSGAPTQGRLNRCESRRDAGRRSLTAIPHGPLGQTHRTVGCQEGERRGGRTVTTHQYACSAVTVRAAGVPIGS
jgi:hypothetical protein